MLGNCKGWNLLTPVSKAKGLPKHEVRSLYGSRDVTLEDHLAASVGVDVAVPLYGHAGFWNHENYNRLNSPEKNLLKSSEKLFLTYDFKLDIVAHLGIRWYLALVDPGIPREGISEKEGSFFLHLVFFFQDQCSGTQTISFLSKIIPPPLSPFSFSLSESIFQLLLLKIKAPHKNRKFLVKRKREKESFFPSHSSSSLQSHNHTTLQFKKTAGACSILIVYAVLFNATFYVFNSKKGLGKLHICKSCRFKLKRLSKEFFIASTENLNNK